MICRRLAKLHARAAVSPEKRFGGVGIFGPVQSFDTVQGICRLVRSDTNRTRSVRICSSPTTKVGFECPVLYLCDVTISMTRGGSGDSWRCGPQLDRPAILETPFDRICLTNGP
jgi:hypothetical protein